METNVYPPWIPSSYLGLSFKQPDCWVIIGVVVDWNCFTFLSPKIWEIVSINDQYKQGFHKHTTLAIMPILAMEDSICEKNPMTKCYRQWE